MKKVVIFALFLFLVGLVSAQTMTYNLVEDKALVEINFGVVRNFELELPYDARTIEVNSNYELVEMEGSKLLKVGFSSDLKVSYITDSVVDKSSKRDYFILSNDLEGSDVTLFLPEGAILDDLVFPDPNSMTTDGKNIILNWNDLNAEEIVVAYRIINERDNFWFYVLMLLVIVFSVFYVYRVKNIKRKIIHSKAKKQRSKDSKKRDVTRNLFGEEKKIIEYLFDKKRHASWTKEIVRDLGISKVRLSRRLRNLKQKGLIEKTPYGNENRIKLLKTH